MSEKVVSITTKQTQEQINVVVRKRGSEYVYVCRMSDVVLAACWYVKHKDPATARKLLDVVRTQPLTSISLQISMAIKEIIEKADLIEASLYSMNFSEVEDELDPVS